jgi:hypothetical protein
MTAAIKQRLMALTVLPALAFLALATAGCATTRINLVKKGDVTIHLVPTKNVSVKTLHVYQNGDDVQTSGIVTRDHFFRRPESGHVDITVYGPDGTIIRNLTTSYTPRRSGRRRGRQSYFSVKLREFRLSQGSFIKAAYHKGVVQSECLNGA